MVNRFIKNSVAGVFFIPMELTSSFHEINIEITTLLEKAHLPIVLIDTDYEPFYRRTNHDLIGIDNYHSGYIATEHLLKHGSKRVDYLLGHFLHILFYKEKWDIKKLLKKLE